jgi:hypothetical protein
MSLRQDVDRAHEILLRQPRLLYFAAIVVTLGAVGYSFRLIFVTPFGSPWLWVTDMDGAVTLHNGHYRRLGRRAAADLQGCANPRFGTLKR